MAAGAPLIPEGALGVAAVVDLLIALLDLLALCVILALLWTYKSTLGAVIEFLVKHTTIHTPVGSFSLLFPLELANNNIIAGMSTVALGLEIAGGRFFRALGVIVGWMVNLALFSATTLEHAVSWLVHVYIPGRASWAASVLFPPALIAKLIRSAIAKELPHFARVAVTKSYTVITHRVVKIVHAVAHPGTIALPGITKDLRWLRNREASLSKRLHKVEGLFAAGVLAAVLAQVFGVATKCLRSGNTGRAVRRICGMDASLFESLLLDTVAILGVISVVEFAEAMLEVEDVAVGVLRAGIREFPG